MLRTSTLELDRLNHQATGIAGKPQAAPNRDRLLTAWLDPLRLKQIWRVRKLLSQAVSSSSQITNQINHSPVQSALAKTCGRNKLLQIPSSLELLGSLVHISIMGWLYVYHLHSGTQADGLVHILVITGLWQRERGGQWWTTWWKGPTYVLLLFHWPKQVTWPRLPSVEWGCLILLKGEAMNMFK